MRRSPSKLLFFGFMTLFMLLLLGGFSTNAVTAQTPVFPTDFLHDDNLYVYAGLDGQNVIDSDSENPIEINLEGPMELFLQVNISDTLTSDINMTGSIVFYYQGIAVFPIQVIDPVTNSTWIWVNHESDIPPVAAMVDLSTALSYGSVKLATGIFEASMDFRYYVEGNATENILTNKFYFFIPSPPQDVFTSVTGISATVATVGAIYGLGNGFWTLFEGVKTAYKLRGIHKKASELKSLPNLTVIGALPLLFSMLAGMTKMGKKKKETKDDSPQDSGVSEYLVRQRLREVAPDAWPVDKCPKCKREWNTKLDICKKCKLTQDEARVIYADLLSSKVPAALRLMGNKKSTDIRTLAKKTKSTDYNAGVIAAAMVDTGVTEIVKVGTPFRSFVLNIAGLAFLVITWQQLLGDSTSTLQTTITLVGAAMSLAIIIALYVSRKSQVEKFSTDMDDGKKWIPTEEEAAAEAEDEDAAEAVEEETEEAATEAEEDEVVEEVADEEDASDAVGEKIEETSEIEVDDEGYSQEIADTEDSEIESEADNSDAEEVEAASDEPEEDSSEEDESEE